MAQNGLEARIREWLSRPRQERDCNAVDGAALGSATSPRRPDNQDRAVLAALPGGRMAAVLADGMGGMVDGAGCAARAAAAFIAELAETGAAAEPAVAAAMRRANHAVYALHGGAGGTTLTGLYAADGGIHMGHAGDTRAYALAAAGVRPLTEDDTALAALPAQQAAGLSAGERAMLGAQLRRAVGIDPDLSPTVRRVTGEWFLLSSDGLHDFASARIEALTDGGQSPAALVGALLDAAAAGGTHDDATAVLVAPRPVCALATRSVQLWDSYGAM